MDVIEDDIPMTKVIASNKIDPNKIYYVITPDTLSNKKETMLILNRTLYIKLKETLIDVIINEEKNYFIVAKEYITLFLWDNLVNYIHHSCEDESSNLNFGQVCKEIMKL